MTNEVLQTIKSRRTVRAYRPDAVPEELLQAVLEAGIIFLSILLSLR